MSCIFSSAYPRRLSIKTGGILALSCLLMVGAIRPGAAQTTFAVEKPSFSPSTVAIGAGFSFSFSLYSPSILPNAIVAMMIRDANGNELMEKDVVQSFQPGQISSYAWHGIITSGQTLSVPFASGHYKMDVYVLNSDKSAIYMKAAKTALFTVPWAGPTSPNVGYTAVVPIQPPAGKGTTYYVSDPGNPSVDQANRISVPAGATVFPTIQAAANAAQPGDTVLVMNGTYEPADPDLWVNAVVTINTSGSATGGYVTYAAYPGDHPVVTSSNTVNTFDVFQILGSYIVLRGFEVIGSARNVTLAYATQAATAEEATLKQEAAGREPATYPSSAAKDVMNGNCIAGQDNTHVIIVNNLVHDCSAAGIGFGPSDYVTIEANTVYNCSWWTMYDTSGISIGSALNSDSSTAYKNFLLDNVSYDNANTQPYIYDIYNNDLSPGSAPAAPTDGEGMIIDTNQNTNNASPYLGRTLVAGNISYANGSAGIEIYKSSHVDVIDNTAYLNDVCPVPGALCGFASATVAGAQTPVSGQYYGQIYSNFGNDNTIANNILYAPANKYVYTNWGNTAVIENNNIMYSSNGQILTDDYTPSAQDITADPLFANNSEPAANYFRFTANSPGTDAGISFANENISVPALLGLTVRNGKVDIGADQ